MEARMSICNMAIEAGARAGMIAPDEKTIEYIRGRPLAPKVMMMLRLSHVWSGHTHESSQTQSNDNECV